jgi:hypothetical protein
MQERRIYERHIVVLPTKLETILTPGEKKVFDVETRNISIGGAFIYSKDFDFFQEGRRVTIDFTIPSGSFFKYFCFYSDVLDFRLLSFPLLLSLPDLRSGICPLYEN